MFEKRLKKAIKQNLKTDKEIIDYCKKEAKKNYSDRKAHDLQCIVEYLQFKLKKDVSFEEYQQEQFNMIWGCK